MDARLHRERIDPATNRQRRHTDHLDDVPDGAFVFVPGTHHPALVLGDHLVPCGPEGYGKPVERPQRTEAVILTPRSTVAALAAGYRPELHSLAYTR